MGFFFFFLFFSVSPFLTVVFFFSRGSESENLQGMASSPVQVASSSPLGCVLRDRNRRDRCSPKGSNSFHKNLKDLVHSCIPRQPRNFNSDSDENRVDLTDLWVHKPQYLDNRNDENNQWNSNKASENWRKVKDVVFPAERKSLDDEVSVAKSESSSVELPYSGGVSSLVRKWSDFEAEAKTNSSASTFFPENVSCVEVHPRGSDGSEESSIDGRSEIHTNDDSSSIGGWESDRTPRSGPPSVRGIDSDATEKERIRVADIIRKLSSSTGDENHDREPSINGGNEAALLPRIRTSSDHQPEQLRCFTPVLNSPRIIRGRLAFNSFIMQVERERGRELEGLVERKAVSKFQQKGRIQVPRILTIITIFLILD